MSNWHIIKKYIAHYLIADSKYAVHSPFVFKFITDILEDKRTFGAFEMIENMRRQLLENDALIHVEDMGAGSKKMKSAMRKISDIANVNLITPKYGELIFRIANAYEPNTILELGTSFGISTLYLATPHAKAQVITLEGSTSVANAAKRIFETLSIKNIEILTGEFSSTLPTALQKLKTANLIFIDGNHRKTPTLQYFETCLPFTNEDSIFIFDDIHWSDEMDAAWKEIKQHAQVTLTIDLFYKGIVFFKKDFHEKQHVMLKY